MTAVPEPHRSRRLIAGVCLVLGLVLVAAHFTPRQRTVDGACLLLPALRWELKELQPGCLVSRADDFVHGQTVHYRLYQFDRPAFVDLEIDGENGLGPSGNLHCLAGQPVASISSTALEIELAERATALCEAQGQLATLRSGAKPEELACAEVALRLASSRLEAHRSIFERHRTLYDQDILSGEEWEAVRSAHEELQLAVRLAEAELAVLRSDAAPEAIAAAESTLVALHHEHDALSRMCAGQVIHTPIAGRLLPGGENGTVLSVTATDTIVVQILVPQRHGNLPRPGQRLRAYLPGLAAGSVLGEVVRVDPEVVVTDAGPFLTVYGVVRNNGFRMSAGMQGRARLYCGESSWLRQAWDDLSVTMRQEMWPL
ncbi:MAG: hypothetical protein ABIF77_05275 [bacterium]